MSSGPNIPDDRRVNKRKSLSLTPAACAVADDHPREASRFASAGLVLLGTMAPEQRERLIAAVARDPESAARAVDALFRGDSK